MISSCLFPSSPICDSGFIRKPVCQDKLDYYSHSSHFSFSSHLCDDKSLHLPCLKKKANKKKLCNSDTAASPFLSNENMTQLTVFVLM